jgi:hypothetical protein
MKVCVNGEHLTLEQAVEVACSKPGEPPVVPSKGSFGAGAAFGADGERAADDGGGDCAAGGDRDHGDAVGFWRGRAPLAQGTSCTFWKSHVGRRALNVEAQ